MGSISSATFIPYSYHSTAFENPFHQAKNLLNLLIEKIMSLVNALLPKWNVQSATPYNMPANKKPALVLTAVIALSALIYRGMSKVILDCRKRHFKQLPQTPTRPYGALPTQTPALALFIEQMEQFQPCLSLPALTTDLIQTKLPGLPADLQIAVFQYLDLKEVVRLRVVSKTLRAHSIPIIRRQFRQLKSLEKEQALIYFYTLRHYSKIDYGKSISLARFISNLTSTQNLCLADLAIEDVHVKTLAEKNENIIALDLSYCIQLTDKSLDTIQEAFPLLQKINLFGCHLITTSRLNTFIKARPLVYHGFEMDDNKEINTIHYSKIKISTESQIKNVYETSLKKDIFHHKLFNLRLNEFLSFRKTKLSAYEHEMQRSIDNQRFKEDMDLRTREHEEQIRKIQEEIQEYRELNRKIIACLEPKKKGLELDQSKENLDEFKKVDEGFKDIQIKNSKVEEWIVVAPRKRKSTRKIK